MKRRWFLLFWLAWLGIASLYFFTSLWWMWWLVILAIAGGAGFEETALFVFGWPVVAPFALGVAIVSAWRRETLLRSGRMKVVVTVIPIVLWLLTCLPHFKNLVLPELIGYHLFP